MKTGDKKEFTSINPYDGSELGSYIIHDRQEVGRRLKNAQTAFESWRNVPLSERTSLIAAAGKVLRDNAEDYARMITREMGKPIRESRAEIKKCAWVCDYYAENSKDFLATEEIKTDGRKSFVRNDPLGTILAIMPWNFPFWQVFRFAAPTLTAGNTGLLKHASNVLGCATQIEDVFKKAGYPPGVFQNLFVDHDQTEEIISHGTVRAVTLTGSERAGKTVGEIAASHLKKTVLELGGSNSFIVLADADMDKVVDTAIKARMLNSGQSCIAAKRFIILDSVYSEFVNRFREALEELKPGNPMEEDTEVGPLARKDLADDLHTQVLKSVDKGAELIAGGKQDGCYYEPTILGGVKPGMPAFDEETFGPLAAMIRAKDIDEAFELSERSRYGLGVTICTGDADKALEMAGRVSDGAYFVNELVKSDPRLPFGGTKHSGYGRELSKDGILEFVNRKTVYLK